MNMCYGKDRDEPVAGVQALALRVTAERLEKREAPPEFLKVTFQVALSFHGDEEVGPRVLARIAKLTGLMPDDL